MATKVKKKLLVVGDGAAGKTYLIHAFAHKSHSSGVEASDWGAGIANEVVDVTFEDKKVEMGLWDTPGQEDYDSLRPLAYSGTDVILIVYSIVYPDSLENILEKWKPHMKHFVPDAPIILVGNKLDCRTDDLKIHGETDGETPVTTAEGLEVANKIGACGFYEISATDGTGVDELLYSATRVAMAKSTIVGSVFKLLKKGIGKMSKGGGGKDASADASADAMFAFGKTTTEQVCPYSSPNGNCKRKFLADEHVIYCDWHTCTNVGCNAKKSKKAAFCPKHVVSSAEKEQWQLGGPAAPSSSLAETFDASNPFGAPPILDLTGGSEMEAFTKNPLRVSKYVAPEIRLGSPMIAAHGLAELLGVSSEHQGKMMIAKEKAIIAEFNKYG
eukprot:gene11681-8354_t